MKAAPILALLLFFNGVGFPSEAAGQAEVCGALHPVIPRPIAKLPPGSKHYPDLDHVPGTKSGKKAGSAQNLKKAGVDVTLPLDPDRSHCVINEKPIDEAIAFFTRTL